MGDENNPALEAVFAATAVAATVTGDPKLFKGVVFLSESSETTDLDALGSIVALSTFETKSMYFVGTDETVSLAVLPKQKLKSAVIECIKKS